MLIFVRKSGNTDLRRPKMGAARKPGHSLTRKLRPEGWNRFDIIAAVRKNGGTLASIARSVELSPKSVGWALIRPHLRANKAIADFLGVPLHELWPQWFDRSGGRIDPRSPTQTRSQRSHTTRVSESNRRVPATKTAA